MCNDGSFCYTCGLDDEPSVAYCLECGCELEDQDGDMLCSNPFCATHKERGY